MRCKILFKGENKAVFDFVKSDKKNVYCHIHVIKYEHALTVMSDVSAL